MKIHGDECNDHIVLKKCPNNIYLIGMKDPPHIGNIRHKLRFYGFLSQYIYANLISITSCPIQGKLHQRKTKTKQNKNKTKTTTRGMVCTAYFLCDIPYLVCVYVVVVILCLLDRCRLFPDGGLGFLHWPEGYG